MSLHSVISIYEAYEYLSQNPHLQGDIKLKIEKFNNLNSDNHSQLKSYSPIQALIIPGNDKVRTVAEELQKSGFDIRPILSPTVKKGFERLRICLHTFNSDEDLGHLCNLLLNRVF